jgi:flagellar motility protein MotE (MotC chaperone)
MKCRCEAETKVIDSREKDGKIKRRRKCLKCGSRWTTIEVTENTLSYYERQMKRLMEYEQKFNNSVKPGWSMLWTTAEDEKLIMLYREMLPYRKIAEEIGRSYKAIEKRVLKLRSEGKIV